MPAAAAVRLALAGSLSLALAACSSPAAPPPRAPEPAPTPVAPTPAPPQSPSQSPPPGPPLPPQAEIHLTAVEGEFLASHFRRDPVDATIQGEHRYDGAWPDVTPAGDDGDRKLAQYTLGELALIPQAELSQQSQIDAQILGDQMRYALFALDQLRARETDPVYYTDLVGEGFDPLVNRNFGTPASRLASVIGRLDGIPAIVAAAKARLAHPPKVNTETAIDQCQGLIDLVEHDLAARFPDGKDALAASSKRAAAALHDFHDYLAKDLLPRSDGSFRLGREKFAKKLAFVLEDDVDIDAIAARAHALLTETQEAMVDTAKQIWTDDKMGTLPALDTPAHKKAFVKQVLDHVAKDHPTNATILGDAKALLAKTTAFVREHDLVRVPDEPVAVIEMPEYRRGVAVAYCDSSGPLEATPETFFAISPTPADWKPARVASFYREYNNAMLADLTIHEAMPGHYLQLMHNNQFPSKLRAIYSSGAFVEGWAVYSEWLMADHGFGGPRVKLERQKMVLRLAANTILDHDIHAGNMDEKAARALMIGEAFQEDGEATGKWRRARLTSAQLTTYYYGFSQLLELRKAAEAKPGFHERAFHDRLLSWGSPAMKFVRQLVATAP
jgi:uncharacterized protein (DUF885 family)